jgi:DNA-binding MarR family transcriptional regulator
MSTRTGSAVETAIELMTAMTRLRARLRAESAHGEMPWTWSQLTTLARIIHEGPTTTSALAQAEHVRRQSMAETIETLRAGGLIRGAQDPDDGRKTLISATRKGQELIATIPLAREAWLDVAIQTLLEPGEQETLRRAAEIMNRLADA